MLQQLRPQVLGRCLVSSGVDKVNNPNIPSSTNAEIEEARRLAQILAAPSEHIELNNLQRYPQRAEEGLIFGESGLSISQQTLSGDAIRRVSADQSAARVEARRPDPSITEIISYIRQVGELIKGERQHAAQNGLPSDTGLIQISDRSDFTRV